MTEMASGSVVGRPTRSPVLWFALAFAAASVLQIPLREGPGNTSGAALAVALLTGVLARTETRRWPPYLVVAIVVGSVGVWIAEPDPRVVVGSILGLLCTATVVAYVLRRSGSAHMSRSRDVGWLAGAAVVVSTLVGLGAAAVLADPLGVPARLLGEHITTTLLASIACGVPLVLLTRPGALPWSQVPAFVAVGLVTLGVLAAATAVGQRGLAATILVGYLALVVLAVVGSRFGAFALSLLLTVMLYLAVLRTGAGKGLFVGVADSGATPLHLAQQMVILTSFTLLSISLINEDRRRAVREALSATSLVRAVVDNADNVIYVKEYDLAEQDPWGHYLLVNDRWYADLPFDADDVTGKTDRDLFSPEQSEEFRTNDLEVMAAGEARSFEEPAFARDGTPIVYLSSKFPMRDSDDRVIGVGGISTDITHRTTMETRLRRSELQQRATFLRSPVATALVHDPGPGKAAVITAVNPAMEALVGQSASALFGTDPLDLVVPDDHAQARLVAQAAYVSSPYYGTELGTRLRELHIVRPDGAARLVRVSAVLLDEESEQTSRGEVMLVLEDVTAQREAEATLTRQALYDGLTGLLNRPALIERLDAALHRMRRHPGHLAVLFIDLDDFKQVNDSLGHSVGDRLLTQVAERLRASVRPDDTVARLGGDEFVVVCEQLGVPEEAALVAGRMQQAMVRQFDVDGHALYSTMSIGIAVTDDADINGEGLLRRADLAMYGAKDAGRNRAEFYHDALEHRAAGVMATQRALRRSIEDEQLVLHYMPIVDLDTGAVVEVEALVRLVDADGGLMAPDDFIAVAESSGLIVPLGHWVLDRALADAAGWQGAGHDVGVAINVTPRQLRLGDFADEVLATLRRYGLHPSMLTLEVTEQAVLDDADIAFHTLRTLRAHGVHVAIDDFGTGYSSLSQLKNLPADVLKVDRSFVSGLGIDPEDTAIVSAVVRVAGDLGLIVVAEGVESEAQTDRLTSLGCDRAQGFLFGRPEPLERLALRR